MELSSTQIDDFLSLLAGFVEPVELNFRWRPQLSDPDDEMFMEAAVNGRANALVTFNTKHFLHAARIFGLELLRPQDVLRRLPHG